MEIRGMLLLKEGIIWRGFDLVHGPFILLNLDSLATSELNALIVSAASYARKPGFPVFILTIVTNLKKKKKVQQFH